MIELRDAEEADFNAIVHLNATEELQTSPMNLGRLQVLHGLSDYHKVATVNNQVAAFLLTMQQTARYDNDNFAWFASRFSEFIYIDRIVVSRELTGMKIGSALYTDLFKYAQQKNVKTLACEYNIEPPNLASKAFHERFGFKEIGTQRVANGSKLVSLQIAEP